MNWIEFNPELGQMQILPKEREYVIVELESEHEGFPNVLVVAYLRYAAGDTECPQFIHPGAAGHGKVLRWCFGLVEHFKFPTI